MLSRVEGISHLTFIVEDIAKSSQLFVELLGAKEIYDSYEENFSISREKFLLIDNLWIALMKGEASEKSYNHIAFKIKADDFDKYLTKIKNLGLEIKEGRTRIKAEAQSIYFYDYDNHLFELHTGTLKERIKGYVKN